MFGLFRQPALLVTYPEIARAAAEIEHDHWHEALDSLAKGFIQFSAHAASSVDTHLRLDAIPERNGDASVRCGGVHASGRFVVKVASTFPGNARHGLSTSQGAMLVFKESTGELEAVLEDGGLLTALGAAATGALVVRQFGPERPPDAPPLTVALFGTGLVAQHVARLLRTLNIVPAGSRLRVVSDCLQATREFAQRQKEFGWLVGGAAGMPSVEASADIIITCTSSSQPQLCSAKAGALVVALGADARPRRELGAGVFAAEGTQHRVAVLADSREQCLASGELRGAAGEEAAGRGGVVELGKQLRPKSAVLRAGGSVLTGGCTTVVVAVSGLAVQDAVLADALLRAVLAADSAPNTAVPRQPSAGQPRQLEHGPRALAAALGAAAGAAAPSTPPTGGAEPPRAAGAKRGPPEGDMRPGYFRDAPVFRADRASRAKASRTGATRAGADGAGASEEPADASPDQAQARARPAEPRAPWPLERLKRCHGRRVQVFWEDEKEWFPGYVSRVDAGAQRVHVKYDDGDKRWYDNSARSGKNLKWYELHVSWHPGAEP